MEWFNMTLRGLKTDTVSRQTPTMLSSDFAASSLVSKERLACPYMGPLLQLGEPRTASTFQWYMLCTIQRACALLNAPNLSVNFHCDGPEPRNSQGLLLTVGKTHDPGAITGQRSRRERIFETCKDYCDHLRNLPNVVVRQRYELFERHGLAGVLFSLFKPIFTLPEPVVREVHTHMKYWAILRQCCGSQQSEDHRLELHGISQEKQQGRLHHAQGSFADPDCEMYQLEVVEKLFLGTLLARTHPDRLWLAYTRPEERIQPGMCAAWTRRISEGLDFNGKNWTKKMAKKDAKGKAEVPLVAAGKQGAW